jgi:predicted Zn finger-like uncharacterized protein
MSNLDDTQAQLKQLAERLEGIDAALARLEEGSYARCDLCGAEIDDDALAADPAAVKCGNCSTPASSAGRDASEGPEATEPPTEGTWLAAGLPAAIGEIAVDREGG